MRFIITGRAIDGLPLPPEQALGAYRASFELLARDENPAITGVWPHADERATTMLVEADTPEALGDILTGLPAYMLSTWEAHPVTTPDHIAQSLQRMNASPQFGADPGKVEDPTTPQ